MNTKRDTEHIDPITFSAKQAVFDLNNERRKRKLSYDMVADKMGINKKNVYTSLRCMNFPTLNKFFKLHNAITGEAHPAILNLSVLEEITKFLTRYLEKIPSSSLEHERCNHLIEYLTDIWKQN